MDISLIAYVKGSKKAVDFYKKAFDAELGYNYLNDDGSYFVDRRGHDVAVKKNVVKENIFTGLYYDRLKKFLIESLEL